MNLRITSKLRIFAALAAICTSSCTAYTQDAAPIAGKDGPPDLYLKAPKESDMTMRLLSLNGKEQVYYLKNGSTYAPALFSATRDLQTKYSLPKCDKIDFYKREILNGTVYFTKVFSIDSKGSSDIIAGLYAPNGDTFKTFSTDISLEKIPLGSFCVINASPFPMGFSIDKKNNKKLGIFESLSASAKAEGGLAYANLDIYDMRAQKQQSLLSSRRYSFRPDRRYIVMLFEIPNMPKTIIVEEMETHAALTDTLIMNDKGPR